MTYPQILLNRELHDIITSPELHDHPPPPPRPLLPQKPKSPARENFDSNKNLVKFISILYIVLLIVLGFFTTDSLSHLLIPASIVFFFSYFWLISIVKGEPEKDYARARELYETREREYKGLIDKYNRLNETYTYKTKEIKGFKTLIDKNASKKELGQYLLKFYFSKNNRFESDLNENKGVSENQFYSYLVKEFPGKIFRDTRVDAIDYSYFPDFTYYDSDFGVLIDIEIDEPYSFNSKLPTHTIGSDEMRNNFFLGDNWIVLRFAEVQVVRQPFECCAVIRHLLDYINGMHISFSSIVELSNLEPVRLWTKKDSENMIAENYRLNYLHGK